MYKRTGGRGAVGKDVSRAGSDSRWAVRTSPHYTVEHSVVFHPSGDKHRASVGSLFEVIVELSWLTMTTVKRHLAES